MFVKTLRHELLEGDILWADAVDGPATENARPVFESELQMCVSQCSPRCFRWYAQQLTDWLVMLCYWERFRQCWIGWVVEKHLFLRRGSVINANRGNDVLEHFR